MDRISQVDLLIGEEEQAAVADCIDRRWLTEGPRCVELREKVAALLGAKRVLLAPNGTLGLFLALLGLDLPRGAEIIIPSFTFYGSATAAVFAGLKPVFIDCDAHTFNATPEAFEAAITSNTAALMPVHVYGHSCDMEAIMALARRRGLKVVEDAAQALSVHFRGKAAGTFGDVGVYSLFSDKIITSGEGGILVTNDDALAARLALLRNQGRPNSGTFTHPELGMNFRMTDMQAAIALAQLGKLGAVKADRAKKWAQYSQLLRGVGDISFMQQQDGSELAPFRFPILTSRRDTVASALEAGGVQTRGFFYPMHLQPKLRSDPPQRLAVCEDLFERGLCLPVHPHLSEADIDRVAGLIRSAF